MCLEGRDGGVGRWLELCCVLVLFFMLSYRSVEFMCCVCASVQSCKYVFSPEEILIEIFVMTHVVKFSQPAR